MVIGAKNGKTAEELQSYNEEALKKYNEESLAACHNCGRTFLPDRLVIHLRSCDKAYAKKAKEEKVSGGASANNSNINSPDIRNRSVKGGETTNCSMCGRSFS